MLEQNVPILTEVIDIWKLFGVENFRYFLQIFCKSSVLSKTCSEGFTKQYIVPRHHHAPQPPLQTQPWNPRVFLQFNNTATMHYKTQGDVLLSACFCRPNMNLRRDGVQSESCLGKNPTQGKLLRKQIGLHFIKNPIEAYLLQNSQLSVSIRCKGGRKHLSITLIKGFWKILKEMPLCTGQQSEAL